MGFVATVIFTWKVINWIYGFRGDDPRPPTNRADKITVIDKGKKKSVLRNDSEASSSYIEVRVPNRTEPLPSDEINKYFNELDLTHPCSS